jgi:subtilisin family serine protease
MSLTATTGKASVATRAAPLLRRAWLYPLSTIALAAILFVAHAATGGDLMAESLPLPASLTAAAPQPPAREMPAPEFVSLPDRSVEPLDAGHETSSPDQADEPGEFADIFPPIAQIPATDEIGRPNYVPARLIVRFRQELTDAARADAIATVNGRLIERLDPLDNEWLLALPADLPLDAAAATLRQSGAVEDIEPDILHYVHTLPNDALYTLFHGQPGELQRWYFNGLGADRCLNAEAAWSVTTGRADVVIAIIDSGVALDHPDLKANLWINPGEIDGNGLDDDGNGFVDDVHGWDFYHNNNDPNPDLGNGLDDDNWGGPDSNVSHGTFVAGCAAAVSNNNFGVTGASWNARIMPLKVFTDDGGAPASAIARAIRYAANNGAHIINLSLGSATPSRAIRRATIQAWNANLVLVASAGNGNSDKPMYPASLPRVISVGGSGSGSGSSNAVASRAPFSQFGREAVDVVAPAVDIVSTAVYSVAHQQQGFGAAGDPSFFYGNGTSYAAPLVAGQVALMMSRARDLGLDSSLANADYRRAVFASAVDLPDDPHDKPDGGPHWDNHGRVDFSAAIQMIDDELVRQPRAPVEAKARLLSDNTVRVIWRDRSNNEDGFLIERAPFANQTAGPFEPVGIVGPNQTSFVDDTVEPDTGYIWRVRAFNVAAESPASRTQPLSLP